MVRTIKTAQMYRIVTANIQLSHKVKNKTVLVDLSNFVIKVDKDNTIVGKSFLKRFKDYGIVKVDILKEIGTTKFLE
jgi:hypothetical protein